MVKDVETIKEIAYINQSQKDILTSFRRPIVLLNKKDDKFDYVSMDNGYLGIMLPYTPIHYLLFDEQLDLLVMTSANISDNPIVKDNEQADEVLKEIADTFLFHNREIYVRCDDSLLYVIDDKEYFIRRSRGYVPFPIKVNFEGEDLLACGGEQKASFALLKNNYAFLSQHIGDLKNIETLNHYSNQIKHFEKIFNISPKAIVCDYHPDYLSTEYALDRAKKENIDVYMVQHHHAHLASCMADNNLSARVIGITWDGTGLGTDGTLWGGEVLVGDYRDFNRVATIRRINLAGGDLATHEIYRIACDLLYQTYNDIDTDLIEDRNKNIFKKMLEKNINTFPTSSIGRLLMELLL